MTQSRIYRISNLTVMEVNLILSLISDRLDKIEGLRGEPTFYDDMNVKTKLVYKDSNGTTLHSMGD